MPRITIKEVAVQAGVSVGSVSRVLNRLPVSDKLEKKVRAVMDGLGCQSDSLARCRRPWRCCLSAGCGWPMPCWRWRCCCPGRPRPRP